MLYQWKFPRWVFMQTGALRLPLFSLVGWGTFMGLALATFPFVHPPLSPLIQQQAKEVDRPSRDEASLCAVRRKEV